MEVYFTFTVKILKANFPLRVVLQRFPQLLCCLIIIFSISSSCTKAQTNQENKKIDGIEYSSQNFTKLVLDSTAVIAFLSSPSLSASLKSQIKEFYTRRNYQFGWIDQDGIGCAAPNFYARLQNYNHEFADSSFKNTRLNTLMQAVSVDEKGFLLQKNQVQELELLLTKTFFDYSDKVYGGTIKSPKSLDWYIPSKKKNYQMLLDSLVSAEFCEKIQEPLNDYYIKLKKQLGQYRAIQKKGGFPGVITSEKLLAVGDSNVCLINAKKHLFLTGDLSSDDRSESYTDLLAQAVGLFQHRMGLVENGQINQATIKELNRPIEFRIKQIMVNLERLRWIPVEMEKDYLLINIPEFKLHIFENSKLAWASDVVVGKSIHQTTIFRGDLSKIVLNPYWGIPKSIVRNEILPNIRRNPNYLARNNMEVINGNYRQKPGKNNALGKIKFLFPNNYSIYLHDTPSKSLFKENARAFSHGCIRVAEPKRLAMYLLRDNETWNEEKVDGVLQTNNSTEIIVSPTVPVYIAYFTAWVDQKGLLNFRNDLYNLDNKLSKEVFGE